MSIVSLLVALVIVGVLLYCVNSMIPLDPKIRTILNVVVIICVVLFVLQAFGLLDSLNSVQVPRIR